MTSLDHSHTYLRVSIFTSPYMRKTWQVLLVKWCNKRSWSDKCCLGLLKYVYVRDFIIRLILRDNKHFIMLSFSLNLDSFTFKYFKPKLSKQWICETQKSSATGYFTLISQECRSTVWQFLRYINLSIMDTSRQPDFVKNNGINRQIQKKLSGVPIIFGKQNGLFSVCWRYTTFLK